MTDSFFQLSAVEQATQVLKTSDPKFLQVMLGPKFSHVQVDWLSHCLFAHKAFVPTRTLKQELFKNFVSAQIQVLSEKMPSYYRPLPILRDVLSEEDPVAALRDWQERVVNYRSTSQDVAQVNAALRSAEEKVMRLYGSDHCASLFNSGSNYFTEGKELTGASKSKDITAIVTANKNAVALKPVLDLNLQNYRDILYQETCNDLKKNHSFRIKEGQSIHSLYKNQSLQTKLSEISKNGQRFDSIITTTCDTIHTLHNEEFVDEAYDKLVDIVLRKAAEDREHPLHRDISESSVEDVKSLIKQGWKECEKSDLLDIYLELATVPLQNKEIDLDLLSVLVVNGASLCLSVKNSETNKNWQITDLLCKKGGKYEDFFSTSIFTITKRARELLFDFPFEKNGLDLFQVVSDIPSEDGLYQAGGLKMIMAFNSGEEGQKQFMSLVRACIQKTENRSLSIFDTFFNFLSGCLAPSEAERDRALSKLYECVRVGHLAIRSGSDTVILDYVRDIEKEMNKNRNPYLRKMYRSFHDILYDCKELPQKIFLLKFARCVSRTLQWSPAWNKIVKNPGYDDLASEWSKARNDDIKKAEREQKQRERELLEAENRDMAEMLKRHRYELNLADFKNRVSSDLNCQFTLKTRPMDMELLMIVAQCQAKIIREILDFSAANEISPELTLDNVLREIMDSRQEVIRVNVVTVEVLERAFESVVASVIRRG